MLDRRHRGLVWILAALLMVLPFTSVYALSSHLTAAPIDCAHQHAHAMHDDLTGQGAHCAGQDDPASIDKCCDDHCNATFNAQLHPDGHTPFSSPYSAGAYAAYRSQFLPDPLLHDFLKPPLSIA